MLPLSCLLPSPGSESTLALKILFDLFVNLPCLLDSFSYWAFTSPSWFSCKVLFALLSLACLLSSPVGESTLALVLLFNLFANLPCSLDSFSHQAVASNSQLSGNVVFTMFATLSLACLLPSPVDELTLALALLFDLFANLLHSLDFFSCWAMASNS